MATRPGGRAANPTSNPLVHEADLKLPPGKEPWEAHKHFFCAAAESMRRILIDRARRRKAIRHGGGRQRTDWIGDCISAPSGDEDELLAVNEGFDRFGQIGVHNP